MPTPSEELSQQSKSRKWEEIHEIARVITVQHENRTVEITLHRYYHEVGVTFAATYRTQKEDGSWDDYSYGQILNGNESEEFSIRRALGFVLDACERA